ncbi:MAG: phage integrase family protein [Enterocloster citroniae]|nr:phage integrase family protein [Enterocloster citroniae]
MAEILHLKDMEEYKELTEHQQKYIGRSAAFDLGLLPAEKMREEIKPFILHRIHTASLVTVSSEKARYNQLCRFIQKKGARLGSFYDWERDVWIRKLKAWMLEEGIPLSFEREGLYGTVNVMKSQLISYLELILDYLEPEDDREEQEKDVWELKKLDIPYRENLIKNFQTLNFTKISQPELREETKKGIYLNLQDEAVSCVARELTAMRRFSGFLKERHPKIQSCQNIDRELIEDYLTYLKTEENRTKHLHSEITRFRSLLESIGKMMDYPNLEGLFLNRDIPPTPRAEFKAYSDAELKRLNTEIVKMDEQMARLMVIHQMLGTRISDTLTLQTDCLMQRNGEWLVQIRQMKTKNYVKPVSAEVAALIQKAIHYTKERHGDTTYIFVNDRDSGKPLKYGTVQGRILRIIRQKDLRDDNGVRFGFGTHMYRHSYGMKLTEMHLDDWTIARLLGHNNLRNVKYYRKMSNQILADETRKVRNRLSMRILECLDGWEEEYEQVRQNDCLE